MSNFYYLIPLSLVLGITGLCIFFWSFRNGQYEDLDGAAERILYAEEEPIAESKRQDPDEDRPVT